MSRPAEVGHRDERKDGTREERKRQILQDDYQVLNLPESRWTKSRG